MKLILFVYFFCLSLVTYSQHMFELCDGESKTVTYTSNYGGDGVNTWTVNGIVYAMEDLTYTFTQTGTYNIVLPNTLGGRELWLDKNNSVYCDRNDDSIEEAINITINSNFDKYLIRNNFLAKLTMQRTKVLYLLKSLLNELGMIDIDMNSFINLPYGNSTINSTQWNILK